MVREPLGRTTGEARAELAVGAVGAVGPVDEVDEVDEAAVGAVGAVGPVDEAAVGATGLVASPSVDRTFFARAATDVAPELLGWIVSHESADGAVAVRLTEVEAYLGLEDPGSHAYRGPTPRTEVMFGPPGHAYVYFSYGMHWCMNVVCAATGTASAVLLRAGEVVAGEELATRRRSGAPSRDLARGPARLTQALGVGRRYDGVDLLGGGPLRLSRTSPPPLAMAPSVVAGPRTGVGGAGATQLWRFFLAGEPTVSPYRAHQSRRRSGSAG